MLSTSLPATLPTSLPTLLPVAFRLDRLVTYVSVRTAVFAMDWEFNHADHDDREDSDNDDAVVGAIARQTREFILHVNLIRFVHGLFDLWRVFVPLYNVRYQ